MAMCHPELFHFLNAGGTIMIGAVSPGYEKSFLFLEQLGVLEAERERFIHGCIDTAMIANTTRGRYELLLTDSDDQGSRYFDFAIRHLDTSDWIISITSAQLDPNSDTVIEPWHVHVHESIENHSSLARFIRSNWPELLSTEDVSQLLPDGQQLDPESIVMLNFIRKLTMWFRQLPS
jgi:hypothetical protein